MRTPLVAGNWKMNNSLDESLTLVKEIKERSHDVKNTEIVVAPPFTALYTVASAIKGSNISLSSQNIFWEEKGAYTGEISPAMLTDTGCKYTIIGHSERRQYFGETNETVNKRIKAALAHKLTPIFCVGETLKEQESGETFKVIEAQLKGGLSGIDEGGFENIVLAYEPVWAIGTGKTATPQQAEDVHQHIRNLLRKLFGTEPSEKNRILYGGSVTPANASELFKQPNIDGGLVGGASLKADSFSEIITAAESGSFSSHS